MSRQSDPPRHGPSLRAISTPKVVRMLQPAPPPSDRTLDSAALLDSLRKTGLDETDEMMAVGRVIGRGLDEISALGNELAGVVQAHTDIISEAADRIVEVERRPLTEREVLELGRVVTRLTEKHLGARTRVVGLRTIGGMVLGGCALALAFGAAGWMGGAAQGRADALATFAVTDARLQAAHVADYCARHGIPQPGGGVSCTPSIWVMAPTATP